MYGFRPVLCLLVISASSLFWACEKQEPVGDPPETKPFIEGAFIDDWTYAIFPNVGSNFDVAEFRLWVPDSTDVSGIRAILVLASSYNSNGLGLAAYPEWQQFAEDQGLGLLAVHFKSLDAASIYDTYSNATDGSGAALLTALDTLCKHRNFGQLPELPFLLRGYSAGGMFSYSFSTFKPLRVLAFANIRGWAMSGNTNENNDIPGLFLLGELDRPQSNNVMINTVLANRELDGLWGYAVQPGVDHFGGLERCDELIRTFFTSVMTCRLTVGSPVLNSMSPANGWLGDHSDNAIYPYKDYPGDKSNASWLIDETNALAWQQYQSR